MTSVVRAMASHDRRTLFASFWVRESATTRRVLARIREGSTYRPDPRSRTAQEIAWQTVGEERLIIDAVETGRFGWTPEPMPTSPAPADQESGSSIRTRTS